MHLASFCHSSHVCQDSAQYDILFILFTILYLQYCIHNIVFATSSHLMKTKAVAAPEEKKMENIVTRYSEI